MKDLLIIFIILLSLLVLISTFGGSLTNAHPETLIVPDLHKQTSPLENVMPRMPEISQVPTRRQMPRAPLMQEMPSMPHSTQESASPVEPFDYSRSFSAI